MRSALLAMVLGSVAYAGPGPDVCCEVGTDFLWPPNHVLVDVGLRIDDHVGAEGGTIRIEVYSDEDDLTRSAGRFSPDAVNPACFTLRLRAERAGRLDGRVYLVLVTATDSSGAASVCALTVVVPHDLSARSIASVWAQAAEAEAYVAANGTAPPEYYLVGDGPVVGPKQ